MIDPWPWNRPVLTAGDAVLAVRTRHWPQVSSRHVYTLVASRHLTVPTMACSLVSELVAHHWARDRRLRDQAVKIWLDRHPQAEPGDYGLKMQLPPPITDASAGTVTSETMATDPGIVSVTPLEAPKSGKRIRRA